MNKDNSLKDLMGELFLIIGGFILAQTIINQFLSLSSEVLQWWVLPMFSILLIIAAIELKNHDSFIKAGILSILLLGGSILFIVLFKNNKISITFFLFGLLILSLIVIILGIISKK